MKLSEDEMVMKNRFARARVRAASITNALMVNHHGTRCASSRLGANRRAYNPEGQGFGRLETMMIPMSPMIPSL